MTLESEGGMDACQFDRCCSKLLEDEGVAGVNESHDEREMQHGEVLQGFRWNDQIDPMDTFVGQRLLQCSGYVSFGVVRALQQIIMVCNIWVWACWGIQVNQGLSFSQQGCKKDAKEKWRRPAASTSHGLAFAMHSSPRGSTQSGANIEGTASVDNWHV